jgi:putative ABC transport system ATP-binding protein
MTAMISIQDMTKIYRMGTMEVGALQGVSFQIERGEFVAIMGPSGSGKSTLMNMIGCLDTPTTGSYTLDGVEVAKLDGSALSLVRAKKLGFVFQQYMLLPRQNALRQVEMPLIYRGVGAEERKRRAQIALSIVGSSVLQLHEHSLVARQYYWPMNLRVRWIVKPASK